MSDSESKIVELTTQEEIDECFPVLNELRSHLDYELFRELLEPMQEEGYTLFGAYDEGEIIGVAGVTVSTNFYLGRHAYVYDLVVAESRRGEGYGTALLEHVHEWASEQGCDAVELESGHWRDEAHRFYTERVGYEKYCYSFKYELDE